MEKITKQLIGKHIKCSEEWYMGRVYYTHIYKKGDKFFGKFKIYYNDYSKKIEDVYSDKEVLPFFGFEILEDELFLGASI
jgi:hypothetical protein